MKKYYSRLIDRVLKLELEAFGVEKQLQLFVFQIA